MRDDDGDGTGGPPIAILRSGRVELWLETRLPDLEARTQIFREHMAGMPPPLCDADGARLALASQGATGADLKAVIEDGKLLFAHDQTMGKPGRPVESYFLEAIAAVRQNRRRYQKRRLTQLTEAQPYGFCAGYPPRATYRGIRRPVTPAGA